MADITPENLRRAIDDGSIEFADSVTLRQYLLLISTDSGPWKYNNGYIVIGNMISNILMQRYIDGLNKQNAKIQKWVIALAIAALISSVVQIFSPLLFR